nr:MAG TPA: hypothetical protein [Caudoviricetes sp.]
MSNAENKIFLVNHTRFCLNECPLLPVRVGGDFLKRPRLAKNRELRLL